MYTYTKDGVSRSKACTGQIDRHTLTHRQTRANALSINQSINHSLYLFTKIHKIRKRTLNKTYWANTSACTKYTHAERKVCKTSKTTEKSGKVDLAN